MLEKEKLYQEAKEAYFSGNPIIGDREFDELEKELNLENSSYIGTMHNPSYTVPHPFIMGSLSKVQIHEKEGFVDWEKYFNGAMGFVKRYNAKPSVIITPKYDGCSFEAYVENGEVKTISTRGDGKFGKDIYSHIINKVKENLINSQVDNRSYILRGEVLITKSAFEKYTNFVNPRSFVAGILNREYDSFDSDFINMINDLSVVIYDIRVKLPNGLWFDYDWTTFVYPDKPQQYLVMESFTLQDFKTVYETFSSYRSHCPYALDGIVIKPTSAYRENNLTEPRPKDCVAVKFLPMITQTTVTNITWQLGKTGEYTPIVWFDEIVLDGKKINKASGHNYGTLIEKGISVGAKIQISLAGDIIPYIYKVINKGSETIAVPYGSFIDECHLMKELSLVDKMEIDFLASCKTLNITGVGEQIAKKIFESLEYKVEHIFFVEDYHIRKALGSGEGKIAENVCKAIDEKKKGVLLHEVIASMNIPDCGPKCAYQCARKLTTGAGDFSGLSGIGWNWCVDGQLPFGDNEYGMKLISKLCALLEHISPMDVKDEMEYIHRYNKYYFEKENNDKILVILTGSPSKYKNKKEFLLENPQYKETTKWNECKFVFTGDLSSSSSKMNKAKKLGIEIKEY